MSYYFNHYLARRMMTFRPQWTPPSIDGYIWAYYEISDISSPTSLLESVDGITYMEIDGAVITPATSYQFDSPGRHTARFLTESARIPPKMFRNVSTIVEVYLPDYITSIGGGAPFGAFRSPSLRVIYIPSSVIEIEQTAFYGAVSLEKVLVDSADDYIQISYPDVSYGGYNPLQYAHHLYERLDEVKRIVFPAGSTIIKQGVLNGGSQLDNIYVPRTVTSIGEEAFMNCSKAAIDINFNNLLTIGSEAFTNCLGLTGDVIYNGVSVPSSFLKGVGITSINMPNIREFGATTDSVAKHRVQGCPNLEQVEVGPDCTVLSSRAFILNPKLKTVILRPHTPPAAGTYVLYGSNALQKILVPYSPDHSILDAYKVAPNLSSFAAKMFELDPDGTIPS